MKKKFLRQPRRKSVPKECYFCKEKKEPVFKDTEVLSRFLTERGKIQPRVYNGLCAKHQRFMTRNIKYARHLSLLPFIP